MHYGEEANVSRLKHVFVIKPPWLEVAIPHGLVCPLIVTLRLKGMVDA